MSTAQTDKPAGEIAFDRVVAMIKNTGMAEKGACAAAGVAPNLIAQARSTSKALGIDAIEKFAAFFKVPVSQLLGEDARHERGATLMERMQAHAVEAGAGLQFIQLMCIDRSHLNPRKTFDADEIGELANSIEAQGLLQNLVVKRISADNASTQSYEIVAGERRWRALCKLWNEKRLAPELLDGGIPCRIVDPTDAEHLALAILENLMRKDVNPMEEAEGFAKLQAMDPEKFTTAYIADQIGTSQRHVQLRLQLVRNLIPETQAALREGKITLANARALTIAPAKKQKDMLKKGYAANFKAEDLKREVTRGWVPCSRARFDWTTEELSGYIIKDGDTDWFADKDKFTELQREAAKQLLADGQKNYAWAEMTSYFGSGWEYKEHRCSPATKGGLVVELTYEGFIHLHAGLVKKEKDKHLSAAEVRRSEVLGQMNDERVAAFEQVEAAIREALTPRDAIMLMLFNSLSPSYSGDGPLQGSLHVNADAIAGPLKKLAGSVAKQVHYQTLAFKPTVDLGTAWAVLEQSKDEDLAEAVALALKPAIHVQQHRGLHAAFIGIARRHGIEIPPIALMGEEEKKAELARRIAEAPAQTDLEDAIAAQGEAA